jgi:hypothetical protein
MLQNANTTNCGVLHRLKMQPTLLILLVVFWAVGCQSQPPTRTVDVTLRNVFTNALDWVELEWNGPHVPGGILSPGVGSTAVGAEWVSVDTAKLSFVDEKTREPYSVEISLSEINKQVLSGNCQHVVFRILSYSQAEAICSDKK